jgi:hypothetical protein
VKTIVSMKASSSITRMLNGKGLTTLKLCLFFSRRSAKQNPHSIMQVPFWDDTNIKTWNFGTSKAAQTNSLLKIFKVVLTYKQNLVHDGMHRCSKLTLKHVEPPLSRSICIKKNIERSQDVSSATQHHHFNLSYLQPTTQQQTSKH